MIFLRIVFLIFVHVFQGTNSLWTVSKVAVQNGTSITIPCHYHRAFRNNLKYWCKGRSWSMCKVMVRTDSKPRTGGVSITDFPSEEVFTITITNLQLKDTDRYWCAVKRIGFTRSDLRTSMELLVTEDPPDLSVKENMVSVEEGVDVSIPCLYGDKLKNTEKKWCKSGDLHSCQSAPTTPSPQEPAVTIADDGRGVFTVTLRKPNRKDTGWYWCSAGDMQAPVHINVTERLDRLHNITATTPGGVSASSWAQPTRPSPGTSAAPKTTSHSLLTHTPQANTSTTAAAVTDDTAIHHRRLIWQSIVIGIGILMAIAIIVGASLNCWLRHKRDHIRIALDDMTQELNEEQDLEEDTGNDWTRSCLLYHSEDPETEREL